MEEKQYRIVFEPDLKDYEDIVALHAKVGKGAAVKVSKGLNLVLLVVGILMFVDAAVMFWLEGRLSGYGILALAVGVFALVFFAFRRRVTALQMRRTNPKFKKRQETVIDASGLRTAADHLLLAGLLLPLSGQKPGAAPAGAGIPGGRPQGI